MPRLPRFFITSEQVADRLITVEGEDVRHIATVMRKKPGDELVLCDGRGNDFRVRILQTGRSEIRTEIVSRSSRVSRGPRTVLGQGIAKADKMDWIVQKAAELGAAEIIPLVTERTVVKIRDEQKRVSRWQKIAREAAMQSDRTDIPKIELVVSLRDFIGTLAPGPRTLSLMPWEEGTAPIREVLRSHPDPVDIIVLIGPEGGFSTAEAAMAREKEFTTVSLGSNILRTETAAIAALSMIAYEYQG